MSNTQITACLVIIGNEILSGRTEDKNINWLATELTTLGINVREVRVVPDIKSTIIDTVRSCAAQYDYIFTTGGIGPTHDDITAESLAECFGTPLELNEEARRLMEKFYGDKLNESRMKMAYIPVGAKLHENPISAAPGFSIENVYVLAGIPSIMQAMFNSFKHLLKGGTPTLSKTVTGVVSESAIAVRLGEIQARYEDIDIGSYPFIHNEKYAVSIVIRGVDASVIEQVAEESTALLADIGELIEA